MPRSQKSPSSTPIKRRSSGRANSGQARVNQKAEGKQFGKKTGHMALVADAGLYGAAKPADGAKEPQNIPRAHDLALSDLLSHGETLRQKMARDLVGYDYLMARLRRKIRRHRARIQEFQLLSVNDIAALNRRQAVLNRKRRYLAVTQKQQQRMTWAARLVLMGQITRDEKSAQIITTEIQQIRAKLAAHKQRLQAKSGMATAMIAMKKKLQDLQKKRSVNEQIAVAIADSLITLKLASHKGVQTIKAGERIQSDNIKLLIDTLLSSRSPLISQLYRQKESQLLNTHVPQYGDHKKQMRG